MSSRGGTILVTGASGFLGKRVVTKCQALMKDVRIFGADIRTPKDKISGVQYLTIDITQPDSIENVLNEIETQFGCHVDVVVHTAAIIPSVRFNYDTYYAINVKGTMNMIDVCRKRNIGSFVHVSSLSAVVNKHTINSGEFENVVGEELPYPSSDSFVDDYARSKSEAERYVLAANSPSSNFRTCAIRPTNIVGPDDARQFEMLTSWVVPVASIVGNPEDSVDFVTVSTVADACAAAAQRFMAIAKGWVTVAAGAGPGTAIDISGKTYHVGAGRRFSKREVFTHPGWGRLVLRIWLSPAMTVRLTVLNEWIYKNTGFVCQHEMRSDSMQFALESWWFNCRHAERDLGYKSLTLDEFVAEIWALKAKMPSRAAGPSSARRSLLLGFLVLLFALWVRRSR